MFKKMNDKNRKRLHRKIHIRKSISGTADRPRLTVTRSNKNLSAQVINDEDGKTLASISTSCANLAPFSIANKFFEVFINKKLRCP